MGQKGITYKNANELHNMLMGHSHETPHSKALKKGIKYTGTHAHSHNKGGMVGEMMGLKNTKHFGVKRGQLKKWRKEASEQKKRGEFPF